MKRKLLSMLLIATMTVTALTGCVATKEKDDVQVTQAPTTTKDSEATIATESKTISLEELEEAGSVDGLTFTNSAIGFSITVPETWSVKGTADTYDYMVNVVGMAKDVKSLKSQLSSQGSGYLFYGADSEVTDDGGSDNILAQSILVSKFGDMDVETILSSFSDYIKQQYISRGATCTISDPVKSVVGDQDVYQIIATATMEMDSQGNEVNMVFRQAFLSFVRNGVLVYLAISTSEEDSAAIAKEFMDNLSFQ